MNKKIKTLDLIHDLCANLFDITIKEEDIHQFINICDNNIDFYTKVVNMLFDSDNNKKDGLTEEEQKKAEEASLKTAKYLWNFLSGMTVKHKLQQVAA